MQRRTFLAMLGLVPAALSLVGKFPTKKTASAVTAQTLADRMATQFPKGLVGTTQAGTLSKGTYRYKITYTDERGETVCMTAPGGFINSNSLAVYKS